MARGTQAAQQARAPGNGGDAGQSGVVTTALADAVGDAGQGGTDNVARPDVKAEAGRGDADSAARPDAEEGAGGDAQEHPASQTEMESFVPEAPMAGVEGVAEGELAPEAPEVEEAHVSVPTEAEGRDDVAAVSAQTAPEIVVPVVQLPDSSEEYGDSMDIDPTAAASVATHITEFASPSADVLNVGTFEGPYHGAIIPSRVPSEFLRNEKEEEEAWNEQFDVGSQILQALDRALQLHQKTGYQVSKVNTFPWELLGFDLALMCFLPTPFHL